MKLTTKVVWALLVAVATTSSIYAQLCVETDGRVLVGNYEYEQQYMPPHFTQGDADTITVLKLHGYNPYGAEDSTSL